MRRAPVYPTSAPGPVARDMEGGPARDTAPADRLPADDYLTKLAKYVPAEVIAFFTPIAAFIGDNDPVLITAVVAGAIGTVGWLYLGARDIPAGQKPRIWTYALALVAFLGWALGISGEIREMLELSDDWTGIILAILVFGLPGVDLALSGRRPT